MKLCQWEFVENQSIVGTVKWADDDLAILQIILSLQNDHYQACKGYGKGHYDSS